MLGHRTISCYREKCYAVITLHPDDYERLRRTHESFYCPAGHAQHFTGKTEEQKKIENLECQLRRAWERVSEGNEDYRMLRDALTHDAQTCPFPSCTWRGARRLPWLSGEDTLTRFFARVWSDMAEHLEHAHAARVRPQAQIPSKTGDAR